MKPKKIFTILICTLFLLSTVLVACQANPSTNAVVTPEVPTAASVTEASLAGTTEAVTTIEDKVYNIVLSNNFVGNQWRLEMQNIAKAMAENNAPYKGHVNFKVVVAEGDPTAQIQSLESIIATKPDAILIDASSPTALNPVLQKACAAGIVVVSFDQYVTEPCTYRVIVQNDEQYQANGEWLVKTIGEKGNIFQDLGLPGQPNSQISNNLLNGVYADYPNISVVGTYEGNYAPGPSQVAVANALAAGMKIDAIYNLAGSDGVIQAYVQAGAPDKLNFVPVANTGDISIRALELIKEYKSNNLNVQFAWTPPTFGGYALEVAWRVLHNEDPVNTDWGMLKGVDAKQVLLPLIVYNTNGITTSSKADVRSVDDLIPALNEGLAPDTQLPYSIPESPVTKEQVFDN